MINDVWLVKVVNGCTTQYVTSLYIICSILQYVLWYNIKCNFANNYIFFYSDKNAKFTLPTLFCRLHNICFKTFLLFVSNQIYMLVQSYDSHFQIMRSLRQKVREEKRRIISFNVLWYNVKFNCASYYSRILFHRLLNICFKSSASFVLKLPFFLSVTIYICQCIPTIHIFKL